MTDEQQEVVIVDSAGTEHVFPAGFDPKKAAAIVRAQAAPASQPRRVENGRVLPSTDEAAQLNQQVLPGRGAPNSSGMRGVLQLAKDHPGQAGAMLAGAVAAPWTGGLSLLPAMAAEGAVGAGGAILGHGAKAAATGQAPNAKDVFTDTIQQGLTGAGGPLIGSALKLLGRGAYRVALAPTQQALGKYGDVVGEGLETATPVSQSGLKQATAIKGARMTTKANAIKDADQRVVFRAQGIADDASTPLSTHAVKQVRAGLPNPTPEFSDRLAQFKAANPNGSLTPSALEDIKGTLDDETGGAWRKIRAREPLSTSEKGSVEMTKAMSRAQESAIPGYRQMNRDVMDAEGLRRSIERRTTGSGGNQVLDTLLAVMKGVSGIPGRAAMMPPLLSRAGIWAYKAAPAAPSALRMLVDLLSPQEKP